jgi:alpha-ketoglutarate-dependent 2,4-dichlorophenoxyacetate dioxygenase
MHTTPLHKRFGVEVHDVDLNQITARHDYAKVREMFDHQSLLLFRNQDLSEQRQLLLGEHFGPIEDRSQGANEGQPVMSAVSNLNSQGAIIAESDDALLNLKSNFLWHTDSTFLPVPSLANIIAARVLPASGGQTELVSTRAAWSDMPEELRAKARNVILWHRYTHSRSKISKHLAQAEMFTKWPDQAWRSIWRNPATQQDALYIASHAFTVNGLPEDEGQALIDELTDWCTQSHYIYSHCWRRGDVMIWDERATLHRGRPWPFDEERTLSSICVSARECDGLDTILPPKTVQHKSLSLRVGA